MTIKIIADQKTIVSGIKSLSTRGAKFDNDVHTLTVSTMAHAANHGDTTLMSNLIAALPAGYRTNSVKGFIEFFGPYTFDSAKSEFTHLINKKAGNHTMEVTRYNAINFNGNPKAKKDTPEFKGALNCPTNLFKPETDYKGFDFELAMCKFLDSVEAKLEWNGPKASPEQKANASKNVISMARLAEARALFPKVEKPAKQSAKA